MRDDAAAEEAREAQARRDAKQRLTRQVEDAWALLQEKAYNTVEEINKELEGTGTSAQIISPQRSAAADYRTLSIVVAIEGSQKGGKYYALDLYDEGTLKTRISTSIEKGYNEHTLKVIGNDFEWLNAGVRKFFDDALSEP